jgi:dTMP kinase
MNRGRFLVFEGIDGSGTTTQVQAAAERLRALGYRTHTTSEPSTGPIGAFIRQILTHALKDDRGLPASFDWRTMALLFAADRADHVEREIEPALGEGQIVISDRYLLSSLAYQSATSEDADAALAFVRASNQGARIPDLQIVFDVDAEVARERRGKRGGAAELYEKDELQRRLAGLYRAAEALGPGGPIVHVNANLAISELTQTVVERILALLRAS